MVKNVKGLEKIVYQAVLDQELEIDSEGRVWRIAKRGWDRWRNQVRLNKCQRTRAEHSAGDYLQVRVMFDKQRYCANAHRLVYMHFKGLIPEGMTINHENGIKRDNRPANLVVATHSEQSMHARHVLKVGRGSQKGEANVMATLTQNQVVEIRQRRANGEPLKSIAKDYAIQWRSVTGIVKGTTWSHIGSG